MRSAAAWLSSLVWGPLGLLTLSACVWLAPGAGLAQDDAEPVAAVVLEEAAEALPGEVDPPPPSSATGVVEELNGVLLEAMQQAEELGYQGRFDLLQPALSRCFDLDFMASKSVGRGWKKLSETEQTRWQEAFGRLITANFAGRFEGWSGQSFETLGEESAAHETTMVLTRIVDPGAEDVDLNYRMQERGDRWRIIDVYFKGTVSELAMRRSEYSSVLKREGFEELITAVDRRIADLASGKVD